MHGRNSGVRILNMDPKDLDELANEFFSAIAAGDIERMRAVYADDLEVWHNATQETQTLEENLKLVRYFTSRVSELRYEVHEREFIPGGFVQRHTLHGKLQSGDALTAPVCIWIYAESGKITRILEYVDSAAVLPAFERR